MPQVLIHGPNGQTLKLNVPDGTDMKDVMKHDFSQEFGLGGKAYEPPSSPASSSRGVSSKETHIARNVTVSPNGLNLIKSVEKFSPTPYEDHGKLAIGYGTRNSDVHPEDTVTQEQADGLLRSHLNTQVVPWIKNHVSHPLTQHQTDALASLLYNVGIDAFAGSRAHKALNKGDMSRFQQEAFSREHGFTKVTSADGSKRISSGLVGRRAKEEQLFNM